MCRSPSGRLSNGYHGSGLLYGHPKPASRPGYQRRHAVGLERQLEGVLAGIAVDLHGQRSVLGLDD